MRIAAIQILIRDGLTHCTTTRIAERAGTSVGTLYQYYPNRDALIAAILKAHLSGPANAIASTCVQLHAAKSSEMAAALVRTFLDVSLGDADASKALCPIAGERGGAALVLDGNIRMVASISAMLASASDARFVDPAIAAAVALSSIVGGVRAVLDGYAPPGFEQQLQEHLVCLVSGYFRNEAGHQVCQGARHTDAP